MSAPAARRTEPLWGPNGLAPTIVQDARDGRVLMLGWMDGEAWNATRESGKVHFHSRTRDRLWRKGESSGHELLVREITLDCDADAILVTVDPIGPTCHRNTRSCFDDAAAPPARTPQGFAWLEELWTVIAARAAERPPDSYTSDLLDAGVNAVGRKVTEEATEVLIAARDDAEAERTGGDRTATRAALAGEAADLLYHALVALAERGLTPAAVVDVLRDRAR